MSKTALQICSDVALQLFKFDRVVQIIARLRLTATLLTRVKSKQARMLVKLAEIASHSNSTKRRDYQKTFAIPRLIGNPYSALATDPDAIQLGA